MPRTPALTRRRMLVCSAAALSGFALGCGGDDEGGFEPLFNGRDLTGWEGDPLLWIAEDGMLIGRSPGIPYNDFLATTESYGDFVLTLSFQLVGGVGNSGIQFRSERVPGSMEMIGYQADIGDGWWGNLYDESRRRKPLTEVDQDRMERIVDPAGWNDYEIFAEGPHIRLALNGEIMADYHEPDPDIPRNGLIALQIHSGPKLEVLFKDIRIRRI